VPLPGGQNRQPGRITLRKGANCITPYPGAPAGLDNCFFAAGTVAGLKRWSLGDTITESLSPHAYWNIGIKVGSVVPVLRIGWPPARSVR
jgi:hypothetical protein